MTLVAHPLLFLQKAKEQYALYYIIIKYYTNSYIINYLK